MGLLFEIMKCRLIREANKGLNNVIMLACHIENILYIFLFSICECIRTEISLSHDDEYPPFLGDI